MEGRICDWCNFMSYYILAISVSNRRVNIITHQLYLWRSSGLLAKASQIFSPQWMKVELKTSLIKRWLILDDPYWHCTLFRNITLIGLTGALSLKIHFKTLKGRKCCTACWFWWHSERMMPLKIWHKERMEHVSGIRCFTCWGFGVVDPFNGHLCISLFLWALTKINCLFF